ncbi:MAG: aminopeptidase P family protein [Lachnospiraceae bacterium]|nr:aminopeptidase P family protein [Lachnospiraceae bacterium]
MKLEKLRSLMNASGIDYYVIPTDDFHASEYVGDYFQAREYISGFTGSAGTLLVGKDFAGLWTDGRYFLQAADQLAGTGIELMKIGVEGVPSLVEYLTNNFTSEMTLGFDGRCVSADFLEELKTALNNDAVKIIYDKDLVGEMWENRPALSRKPAWFLEDESCGASRKEKIAGIREEMKKKDAEALLLTSLDDIAWLFNMRGDDIAYNPVVLSFCIITEKEVRLFIQKGSLNAEQEIQFVMDGIMLDSYLNVYDYVKTLSVNSIWLNDQKTSYALMENIPKNIKIIKGMTPVAYTKCVKNTKEQENIRNAHLKDGVAMTKFMYWLKANAGKMDMTEISVAEQAKKFRKAQEGFVEESFTTICGYGPHGAIIHYSATEETNAVIKPEGLLLVDSGGQYLDGTTDITRTFAMGPVTEEEKRNFTTVLRSNLRLGSVKFKEGCTGENLDMVARQPLWEEGLDYNHGTGHGIGFVLNVHETPARINWKGRPGYGENEPLKPGMIVSNEPGFYKAGAHGIRLENLILCQEAEATEYGRFLNFETLTLVPFDLDVVDVTLLDSKEKQLLNDYHSRVYSELAPYMTEEELVWLKEATRAI